MFEAVVVALYSAVMVWLFICAVIRTIDEEGERAMKVKKQKQLRKQAQELASMWGTEVEEWMLWDGWENWVGCEWCREGGPDAECWGFAGCHGYERGCGCRYCVEQEEYERHGSHG